MGKLPRKPAATWGICCGFTARMITSDCAATRALSAVVCAATAWANRCLACSSTSEASSRSAVLSPALIKPFANAVAIWPAPINPIRCCNILVPYLL